MEEWKECKIEDVIELLIDYRGKTPKKSDTGIPTLSAKSVKMNHIDYSQCYYISKEEYDRFMIRGFPKKGDILLTTEAPLGMIAKLDRDDVALGQRLITLRGKEDVLDNGYLLYYFQSPAGQYNLKSRETGTTVTGIKQSEFRKLRIPIPSLPTQQKIAAILSSLDDKIELNNKINTNLEQQAQALFKNWFVDFEPFGGKMPEGWKVGKLSDIGTIVGGSTPSKAKKEYYTNNGIAWITPKDLSNDKSKFISHGEIDITELGFKNSSAIKMPKGTVLYSSRAPIGYIAISKNEVTTNQGFKSVIPNPNVGNAYIYYFLKSNFELIDNMASGSTFKEISGTAMKNVPVLIPDDKTLYNFQTMCETLFSQQELLENENRNLSAIRDTLLPKLMNKEVKI